MCTPPQCLHPSECTLINLNKQIYAYGREAWYAVGKDLFALESGSMAGAGTWDLNLTATSMHCMTKGWVGGWVSDNE